MFVRQGLFEKGEAGIGNGETTVELAARNIDIERLLKTVSIIWNRRKAIEKKREGYIPSETTP